MRKILSLILFFYLSFSGYAFVISDEAKVSLLTADPGEELYSIFGHSAIRVQDPATDTDLVFNYGTFDFSTPNFYYKFVRGKLPYMLSVSSFRGFMPEYVFEDRTVYEQELNIPHFYKQELVNLLEENLKPENRYYPYDFFFDNCATRIRDIIARATQNHVTYNGFQPDTILTFRQLLAPFLYAKPWSKLGIDLILGLPTDKIATPAEYMFLPDWMMKAFAESKFGVHDLVKSKNIIHQGAEWDPERPFFNPMLFFCLFFLFSLTTFFSKQWARWFDVFLFAVLGILGFLILFLWFASEHLATKDNFNLLWALPTHLFVAGFLLTKRFYKVKQIYFGFSAILSLMVLVCWNIIPQVLHPALVPFLLTILLRSLYRFRHAG
ncbi:MAG: DUF4105 domain-containing protein [Bacteroidota bacterium]